MKAGTISLLSALALAIFGIAARAADLLPSWNDKALDAAEQEGWTVVDMKRDWRRIHPFETAGK